jgi:hypothetical protein
MTVAQCKDCPLTYELMPPADVEFDIPKEIKPTSGEFLERFYECQSGHRNTVYYWTKKEYFFFFFATKSG